MIESSDSTFVRLVRAVAAVGVLALCVLAAVLALAAGCALASATTVALEGHGAGQVELPSGVAVNTTGAGGVQPGTFYVADRNNQRVDQFSPAGVFVTAWGFGVRTGATEFQTCTAETGCLEGLGASSDSGVYTGGSFDSPDTIAVDQSSGAVYVYDDNSSRVQRFSATGSFQYMIGGKVNRTASETIGREGEENICPAPGHSADVCQGGAGGAGNGEFGGGNASRGVPLAVDGAGDLWAGDPNRVQEFDSTGMWKASVSLAGRETTLALAVTANGADVYAISSSASFSGVREYETATGNEVAVPLDETGEPLTLAVGSGGELFVGGDCHQENISIPGSYEHRCGKPYVFRKYESGVLVSQFGAGQVIGSPEQNGITIDSAADRLYVVSDRFGTKGWLGESGSVVQSLGVPVPGPLPSLVRVEAVESTCATFSGVVNPEGKSTTYSFEYGTSESYVSSTLIKTLSETGFEEEPVSARVCGLTPGRAYHLRVTASNTDGTVAGEDVVFETLPAVGIEASVLSVTSTTVMFEGVLNPLGVAARWWVECGPSEAYGSSSAAYPLAGGTEPVSVKPVVENLSSGVVYHCRIAASDEREGHSYTSYGPDVVLVTQPPVEETTLLDGRMWELVSPLSKGDAGITPPNGGGGLVESAQGGDALAYTVYGYTEEAAPGEPSPQMTQVMARHTANGWASKDIEPAHSGDWGAQAGNNTEYFAFSGSLSSAIVEPFGPFTQLSSEATERTPYLRDEAACANGEGPTNGCYVPLVTAANTVAGAKWGAEGGGGFLGDVKYAAASANLEHVVFESSVPLLEGETKGNLYEWTAGKLEPLGCSPALQNSRNAVSDTGLVVCLVSNHIYIHDPVTGENVQLDRVQPGATGYGRVEPAYQDASTDEDRVFFTDQQQLTEDSYASSTAPDLFMYQRESGTVKDLTVPVNKGEQADVLGLVPGVSSDGGTVYFVANGVLTSELSPSGARAVKGDCEAGQTNASPVSQVCNLYVWHDGATRLIAVVSGEDNPDWAGDGGVNLYPLGSHVSGNGQWFAFMSLRSLTGYNNEDVTSRKSGERMDEEVFLYNATSNRLVCASCDPTSARPRGVLDEGEVLFDGLSQWSTHWISGVLPGWQRIELFRGAYDPRALSDGGRLFFDSADALVPQDSDGVMDAYEFEPVDVGSCTEASATYSPIVGGCVGLVSSGTSSQESAFLDASENGNDVFFMTASKLVNGDTDTAYDVYDAHVCGTQPVGASEDWACAAPGAVPPACTTASSCRGAPTPQPTLFGPAGTAVFNGTGNVSPPAPTGKTTPKGLTSPQKLANALKSCRKQFKGTKRKKQRTACEKQARKRFGTKAKGRSARKAHAR